MNLSPHPIIRLDGNGWLRSTPHAMRASRVLAHARATNAAELRDDGRLVNTWRDPLDALAWMQTSVRAMPKDSRWIGYLSYDVGRWFESLPNSPRDDLQLPMFAFGLCDASSSSSPLTDAAPGVAETDDRAMEFRATGVGASRAPFLSTFTRDEYLSAVKRVVEYVRAGDVFQVNLAQRLSLAMDAEASVIDARLRARSPATYGAMLDFGAFALLSNSPELFLLVTPDGRIANRPIKGTRPRGEGMERELRESAKDIAELAMIVDLQRNDLGRVCETGSVRVTEARAIEAHPTVHHGVATIEGRLRGDVTFVDLLRATFPCGSVTGAPKIRAMQIIDQLEPVARGPYCGAIGYLASDGTIEFNVAIRTMICKDGQAHVPVGGGIVADSHPDAEHAETITKAQALLNALQPSRTK